MFTMVKKIINIYRGSVYKRSKYNPYNKMQARPFKHFQ